MQLISGLGLRAPQLNLEVRRARLAGAKAAEKILRILEVRQRIGSTQEQVDVFDALAWLDVRVVFKPLDTVLGLYIRGEHPGVMISTKRPLSVQRFTAAHELGHAVMKHEPSLDSENVLRRAASGHSSPKISGFASYLQEIEADSFAGAFVLPMWLIVYHAQKHGWSRSDFQRPEVVYQLSLRCGSSYQAAVWALQRNAIIDAERRTMLLGVQPKALKTLIGHVAADADTRSDAWVLDEGDNKSHIPANVGDTLTVALKQNAGAGYLWLAKETAPSILSEIDKSYVVDRTAVGSPSYTRSFYRADAAGSGTLAFKHRRPWESSGDRDVVFNFVISEQERGLSRANRTRLISEIRRPI